MTGRNGSGGCLTRDAILEVEDLPRDRVEVPEWGGHVFVRTMTGNEKDRFEHERFTAESAGTREGVRARLLVWTLCDESGERLFDDEDIETLGKKSAAALDRCYEKAAELNKMTAKDIEELVKNLLAARSAASNSGSPSPSGEPAKSS